MKKALQLLAISLAALSASTAIAEPGKWYIGVGAGLSRYNDWVSEAGITTIKDEFGASLGVVNFDGAQSADSDDTSFGYKLFGGYWFHENLAVEFSYIDMGEVDASSRASGTFFDPVGNSLDGNIFTTARAEVDAFTLDVNLNVPITPVAALMVKAGVYNADTELELRAGSSISTEAFNYSKTESSTGLHFGIGINVKITDAIGVRAEWERLDNVEARDGDDDVDLISAALIYSF